MRPRNAACRATWISSMVRARKEDRRGPRQRGVGHLPAGLGELRATRAEAEPRQYQATCIVCRSPIKYAQRRPGPNSATPWHIVPFAHIEGHATGSGPNRERPGESVARLVERVLCATRAGAEPRQRRAELLAGRGVQDRATRAGTPPTLCAHYHGDGHLVPRATRAGDNPCNFQTGRLLGRGPKSPRNEGRRRTRQRPR